jgi:hypothetical protein
MSGGLLVFIQQEIQKTFAISQRSLACRQKVSLEMAYTELAGFT